VKSLLHFCKFFVNPNFVLKLTSSYIFRKTKNRCFQLYIVCTEILSTFHTQVEPKTLKNAIQVNGAKTQPTPIPFRECQPLSNTPIPQSTTLTTPNSIHSQSPILPQNTLQTKQPTDGLCNKPVPRPNYDLLN